MLATFHWLCLWSYGGGEWLSVPCSTPWQIRGQVEVSKDGIKRGLERCFYIEWHAQEEA